MKKTCNNCGTPITKEYCEDSYPEVCEHWTPKKPKTNADRIRAMSDEELADVVANGVGCVLKAPHCMDCDCTPCILKWLKQPAEEDT